MSMLTHGVIGAVLFSVTLAPCRLVRHTGMVRGFWNVASLELIESADYGDSDTFLIINYPRPDY